MCKENADVFEYLMNAKQEAEDLRGAGFIPQIRLFSGLSLNQGGVGQSVEKPRGYSGEWSP